MRATLLFFKPAIVFLVLTITSYVATLFLALFLDPAPLSNLLGGLALVAYSATLLPSLFHVVFPSTKGNKVLVWLLKNRRYLGITTIFLVLDHIILTVIQGQIDLIDTRIYIKSFPGITMLIILTLLAMTSNNWSIKLLKKKNWKKLHQLTYLVIFLLPWHILDKMSYRWTYLTPFAVLLSFFMLFLFIKRKGMELFQSKHKSLDEIETSKT